MKLERYIITGGPGTGKTSVLDELKKAGMAVCNEKARQVIKEQLRAKSQMLPWKDVAGFSGLVVGSILEDSREGESMLFDRGIPDVIGYLRHAKKPVDLNDYRHSILQMNYHQTVFFAPPWEGIYQQDTERKEAYEDSVAISKKIKQAYLDLGFELIEIPKVSVTARATFILDAIRSAALL